MDLVNWLERVKQVQSSSFIIYHDPAIPARELCGRMARTLGEGVIVAELQSDHIDAEEGAFVRDALMQGKVLLLIAAQGRELPAQLLRAWNRFNDNPEHTSSGVGRFIHFEPPHTSLSGLGMLGIIVPRNYEGEPFDEAVTNHLGSEDLVPVASPPPEVRMLGRPAVSISMKDLCFLHQRDGAMAQHHGSIQQIMSGDGSLTWTDLQLLLQTQPNADMFAILEGFAAGRRATSEQLDFAAEAIAFLRREKENQERIGGRDLAPSIYHALWAWAFLERQGCVFRGQRDSRWRQDCSLLRAEKDGPPTFATITERLQRTQTFLDKLAAQEQRLLGCTLDEGERLAIAQHYGMPTPLLDYTRSLAVAAFFATGGGDATSIRAGDIGVIYFIRPDEAVAAMPGASGASGFDFASAAGLNIGRLAFIEPKLPDKENRIARQKALFVEGFDSRDLQRMASGVLHFRQQPGEAFEDGSRNVTTEYLLAHDAELQRLADGVNTRILKKSRSMWSRIRLRLAFPPPQKFSARLGGIKVSSEDIFGALGLSLSANLYKAQKFLDKLAVEAERLQPGLWPQLRAIIERHLGEARIAARTADIAAPTTLVAEVGYGGIPYMLDDVDFALGELAESVGLKRDALQLRLAAHRPLQVFGKEPFDALTSRSETPVARIVLAIGLFLVGLEYLRTVRGSVAAEYFDIASLALVSEEGEITSLGGEIEQPASRPGTPNSRS